MRGKVVVVYVRMLTDDEMRGSTLKIRWAAEATRRDAPRR